MGFEAILDKYGLQGVTAKASLNRASALVTVTLISQEAIPAEKTAAVEREMAQLLPGLTVCCNVSLPRTDAGAAFASAASNAVKASANPKSVPAQETTSLPSAAATVNGSEPAHTVEDPCLAARTVKLEKVESNVIMGVPIKTPVRTKMCDLKETSSAITVEGVLVSKELKEGWKGKDGKQSYRLTLNLTDYTDSIYCTCTFYDADRAAAVDDKLNGFVGKKERLLVRGLVKLPKYGKEIQLFVNDINFLPAVLREDTAEEKRVELHLHSRMSTMDGLTSVTEAFKTAKRWGHKALAITDHGVVQAFPEAAKAAEATGVKAIFGVEGYLLPDADLIEMPDTFVVFDLETTGLKPEQCEIIEVGAVKLVNGVETDRFCTFVNDGEVIPPDITKLTGINNDMIAGAPNTAEVLRDFLRFCEGATLVAHNASFDMGFVLHHGERHGISFANPYADTLMLSRHLQHELPNHKLDTVCEALGISLENHHRAVDDASATAEIFIKFLEMLKQRNVLTLPVSFPGKHETGHRKGRVKTNHIILLAKTQAGMKNLYRIVSYAHLDHFHTHPTIPRSLLALNRGDIIIGSACEQGELFRAIVEGKSDEQIEAIAEMYDYFEIQPLGNNRFMVREGIAESDETLRDFNRKVVALGKKLGKPVVATGDVHFLEPEDAQYRMILMMKLGFKDAQEQAPLYFKTTDEMLEEFSYLGEEEARRVVIEAPNAIADMCDVLRPFPAETHAPNIPNAGEELRERTMSKAHAIYGDPLPEIVQARLDKELKSIIGNNYSSLYLLAQRLVFKSNSDGYLVGSRGSVGSSLVATMAGITEVNALQPHYVCPNCKHSEFDVPPMESACGVDLPDKNCPVCGTKYRKDGFTIPFEVFLGFKGDKTPDIDLNFSGEYQPRAHKYVEEMFGVGHAFRAGTISGLAEKKAFECVYHYMEETGKVLRRAEMERLAKGCMNVKVTTGQHPGGIVIVPKEDDVLDFTPVQYPADKTDSKTITTHFDFHSMDEKLVKLDILGHDDPTVLRMLQDITGFDPKTVPLDDPQTMRIFISSDPLGVDLSALDCHVGSLGIPEFGTPFVRGVLDATHPQLMEELVRISGLTHGTDVWLGNAEPLVINKIAKLAEVNCTRDDIMNYLIAHGMEPSMSFRIMEDVRKGKGLKPEQESAMIEGAIPQWFIDSCKKIKYMFPRGHAVAYTMMAFRVAYFKVHMPLAYYAVYFTVRADGFDLALASGGADKVLGQIRSLHKAEANADTAEKKRLGEQIIILELVYEMNLRGIELLPVDIYTSSATKFRVEGKALRPPFNSIAGVGDNAAIAMEEKIKERNGAPFLSVEDFRKFTGANSGVISAMRECGCFKSIPEENQISLF